MDRSISGYNILFILMLYALFLIFTLNYFGWIVDDLYIYFRYVNNFVNGDGLVYNPGEFTEGYSGFSWLMVLSVFGFLNLPLEFCGKVTCLLLAFLIYFWFSE